MARVLARTPRQYGARLDGMTTAVRRHMKPKRGGTRTRRACLRCDRPFPSTGRGNRLCDTCRERVAGVGRAGVRGVAMAVTTLADPRTFDWTEPHLVVCQGVRDGGVDEGPDAAVPRLRVVGGRVAAHAGRQGEAPPSPCPRPPAGGARIRGGAGAATRLSGPVELHAAREPVRSAWRPRAEGTAGVDAPCENRGRPRRGNRSCRFTRPAG
jgi:hypothetical protein